MLSTGLVSTRASPVPQGPRLPRQTQVDVAKCHAYHANGTPMSLTAAPATQSAAASRATNCEQARHQSQPSATSATPATQMERRCDQVSHLPRKGPRRPATITENKRATRPSPVPQVPRQVQDGVWQCHACHAKRRWMSPSATPAT